MGLQQKVGMNLAPAIAGMPGSVIDGHYTTETPQAADQVTIGTFVFADGTNNDMVTNKGTATKFLRGLAVYVRNYVSANLAPSMVVPKGAYVTVATQGNFWVIATNATPKVGQYVYAKQADGTIHTDDSNANGGSDKVLTNFRVVKVMGKDANSLVLISNQGTAVTQVGA